MDTLLAFEKEINKDWTSNYRAILKDKILIVETEIYNENNEPLWVEAGWIKDNLDFGGDDEDVVDQLKYMIER